MRYSLLDKLPAEKNPAKSARVMKAMLQMDTVDSAGLQQACDQG